MTRKAFDGGTVATTLNGSINASVTTLNVTNGDSYPSSADPFVIAIDRGNVNEEKILIASRSGNTFTVSQRGYDGTVGSAHDDQAVVEHVLDALTIDEANAFVNTLTTTGDLLTLSVGSPARVALGTTGLPLVAGASLPSYAQLGSAGIADEAVTSAKIENLTIVDGDISNSAAIADTKLATIATANKVAATAIDIDGATDIGAALVDTDLILVDDGANGTNRKSALSRIATWLFAKVSGDITVDSSGVAAIGADKVTSAMIGNGVIGPSELATDAVETLKIKDGNVTAAKLASNAVETAKLNDGAVTNAKLNTTAGEPGGAWVAFTPNVSGGTVTGAKSGRYIQIGKTVDFWMEVKWDTGSNFSGLQIDLPVTAQASVNEAQFNVSLADGLIVFAATCLVTTTNIVPRAFTDDGGTSGLYIDSSGLSNTIPFTWATNDTVRIAGRYEAA